MKNDMLHTLGFAVILSLALACGDDDYIPPRILPPEEKPVYIQPDYTPPVDGEPYTSCEGLIMCGYQGWHACPGDGSPSSEAEGWSHYNQSWNFPRFFAPGVGRNSIDYWPDVSEYEKTYEATAFTCPDGSHPRLFSAYDESSVLLHFKWMKDYGIDGVFMQRFASQVGNSIAIAHQNKVLESAMKGSETYGRAICIMYDMVGTNTTATVDELIADARGLIDKYHINDPVNGPKYYLQHNGKPLIGVVSVREDVSWGIADCKRFVDALKEMGFSIILSCDTYWRTGGGDVPYPTGPLQALIKEADFLTPWYTGRYDYDGSADAYGGAFDSFKKDVIKNDKMWLDGNGVGFVPLCFPGFSDQNISPGHRVFARHGGDFFWKQLHYNIAAGAKMIYIAMFDEIDEGTAIYKCLNEKNLPSNVYSSDYYVVYENGVYSRKTTPVSLTSPDWCALASTLGITFKGIEDELGTDHYLWLAGQAGKMMRGEIPLTEIQPKRN